MIRYFLEDPKLELRRGTDGASGYDVMAVLGTERTLAPGERWLVSTGLYLSMPKGVEAQVRSRSGLAINHGVVVLNAPGTVDSDYRGEVKVSIVNLGNKPYDLVPGERIAQLVFGPVFPEYHELSRGSGRYTAMEVSRVDSKTSLGYTERGDGGHGSTGR
jgi:dUTP pyrophosphatase